MTSNLILWMSISVRYGKPTVQIPVDLASSSTARRTDAARGTCAPIVTSALLQSLNDEEIGVVQNVDRQPKTNV